MGSRADQLEKKNLIIEITKYFRLNGVNVRSGGVEYLCDALVHKSAQDRKVVLEQIIRFLQRQSESSVVISQEEIVLAYKEFTQQESIVELIYDEEKKHYTHANALGQSAPRLHETADWKTRVFVERYEILFQRCLRNPLFVRSSYEQEEEQRRQEDERRKRREAKRKERTLLQITQNANDTANSTLLFDDDDDHGPQTFVLRTVEELLSSSVPIYNTVVLGMLSSLTETKYHLEDPTGAVEIDIGIETAFHSGLFIENVFVIVEGWYEDRLFHATGMGMPLPEPRSKTQLHFGDFNFFGGPSQVSLKLSSKLKRLEQKNADDMIVIVSDLWLDRPDVLSKIDVMFKGFHQLRPFCFVFCGDFVSQTERVDHGRLLQEGLDELRKIIQKYPGIEESRFVFVPGPADIGSCGLLPRQRLPPSLTASFESKVKNAIFATNPCRIQYCTKEIVIIREDILTKMCRTLIRDPVHDQRTSRFRSLTFNLARTIACQGHLCPLPPHILPTYWSYDHVFRLYTLPDLIVIADIQEPFVEKDVFLRKKPMEESTQNNSQSQRDASTSCLLANPSSFPRHNFQFHVYMPFYNNIELSQIE
ncbi:DNA polymerase epsilon subunit 2-like isoform X2 [Paramacrobiotus metropolitanus]|uniref:DNA polymerase epsilon subunit 2-like isoform X2 n=1 Tax=Paramacrobiotus metropolitanus TaxID=2943436 RepID=UPI0024461C85|nr:DNA polymerase epsilon subunit 2-like isoform X2 [Paramacrobiotus metropolitanus]